MEKGGMNISKTKSLISKIFWGIILALVIFFFGKTAIFEYNYYREKEGSTRAASDIAQNGRFPPTNRVI